MRNIYLSTDVDGRTDKEHFSGSADGRTDEDLFSGPGQWDARTVDMGQTPPKVKHRLGNCVSFNTARACKSERWLVV